MAKNTDYSNLVTQAEKAVQGVKDPELRRIAFQKILEDLLGAGSLAGKALQKKARKSTERELVPKRRRGGPTAYIRELVDEGFFKKPKTITELKAELENRGHHVPLTSLSGPLQGLCKVRVLRRQKAGGAGNKEIYSYSNW